MCRGYVWRCVCKGVCVRALCVRALCVRVCVGGMCGCVLSVHMYLPVRESKYNKKVCVCVCVCVCLNIKFVCTWDDYAKSYVYLFVVCVHKYRSIGKD